MNCSITILGSGSKGNSIIIHNKKNAIMIDAGFSRKELLKRLALKKISPENISALLITHEHIDHVRGARVFADAFNIPTYLTSETLKRLDVKKQIGQRSFIFSAGSPFNIDDWKIIPFLIPHDAAEPVGFVIETNNIKIGIATDLGYINRLTEQKLFDCDVLIIESNYDVQMLRNSERPLSLKQRILSRHGHLNNQDTIDGLEKLLTPRTKNLFLAHLSSDCNTVDIVETAFEKELKRLKRDDIICKVLSQTEPAETIML